MRRMILYLGLGTVMDLLITLYNRCTFFRLKWPGSILGAVITLASFVIFNRIIVQWNKKLVMAYAIGTGIGTFLGMLIL